MFSNFKKAFITRPQFTTKTPDIILKNASADLPKGFTYVDDPAHPGFCRLDCGTTMEIKPSSFKLLSDPNNVFQGFSSVTMDQLQQYCYNSQSEVELLPDENGNFSINGEMINHDHFVVAPLKDTVLKNGRLLMKPPEFPKPFPVELAGNDQTIKLMVERKPSFSLNVQKYSSITEEGLQLSYSFDASQEQGTMNINLSIKPSDSADVMLMAHEILNGYLKGNGSMCGLNIQPKVQENAVSISNEVLKFWKMVAAVEKTLSVKFILDQQIELEDVKYINILYNCLVNGKPYKEYRKEAILNGEIDKLNKDRKEIVGKELLLEFTQVGTLEIFGVKLEIYNLIAMFNGIVEDMSFQSSAEEHQFRLKLVPAKGKKLYASMMWFTSLKELERFKSQNKYILKLQNADELEQ